MACGDSVSKALEMSLTLRVRSDGAPIRKAFSSSPIRLSCACVRH